MVLLTQACWEVEMKPDNYGLVCGMNAAAADVGRWGLISG